MCYSAQIRVDHRYHVRMFGAQLGIVKLQPQYGLELHLLAAKGDAQSEALTSVFLNFDQAFSQNRVGVYERLLRRSTAGRIRPAEL